MHSGFAGKAVGTQASRVERDGARWVDFYLNSRFLLTTGFLATVFFVPGLGVTWGFSLALAVGLTPLLDVGFAGLARGFEVGLGFGAGLRVGLGLVLGLSVGLTPFGLGVGLAPGLTRGLGVGLAGFLTGVLRVGLAGFGLAVGLTAGFLVGLRGGGFTGVFTCGFLVGFRVALGFGFGVGLMGLFGLCGIDVVCGP